MAERVLRDYRSRYPAEWKSRGEPTFVSFAVLGERWWRPITAFNFFYCRKYLELGDPELAQRADRVRVLQNVAWGIPNVWLLLGVFVFVLYR